MFRFKRMFSSMGEKINTYRDSGYPFFSLLFLYVHTNYKYNDAMYEIHQLKLKLIELRK